MVVNGSAAAHGRVLAGYVMPWNETTKVGGRDESFRRGAFDGWFDRYPPGGSQSKRVALNLEHNRKSPIGVMTYTENRAEGQYAEFRLADTPSAREAAVLVDDGVLGGFSVEFKRNRPALPDGTITDADLVGVGVVSCPIYDGAVLFRDAWHEKRHAQRERNRRRRLENRSIIHEWQRRRGVELTTFKPLPR